MSKKTSFKNEYEIEAKERWGNTDAYRESEEKTKGYSDDKWADVTERGNDILKCFGKCRHLSPESDDAQSLVKEWQQHITDSFYNCTDEILYGLGQMYVYDERFKENIDKNGEGTAEFMSAAIEVYCKK